jgi:hypothetical protein
MTKQKAWTKIVVYSKMQMTKKKEWTKIVVYSCRRARSEPLAPK